jgi:hypothetical protein
MRGEQQHRQQLAFYMIYTRHLEQSGLAPEHIVSLLASAKLALDSDRFGPSREAISWERPSGVGAKLSFELLAARIDKLNWRGLSLAYLLESCGP